MNERQNLTDASSEREAYSAPNYKRFIFETNELIQTSAPEPVFASVGNGGLDESAAGKEGW